MLDLVQALVVVLLAYPVAYYLALSGTKRKYVLLLILIAPFLTSYLLRVLAWKVILGNNGVLNSFLAWTGIRSADHLHLLRDNIVLFRRRGIARLVGYNQLSIIRKNNYWRKIFIRECLCNPIYLKGNFVSITIAFLLFIIHFCTRTTEQSKQGKTDDEITCSFC